MVSVTLRYRYEEKLCHELYCNECSATHDLLRTFTLPAVSAPAREINSSSRADLALEPGSFDFSKTCFQNQHIYCLIGYRHVHGEIRYYRIMSVNKTS